MKKIILLFLFIFSLSFGKAQYTKPTRIEMPKVPAMRLLSHDYIDNNQKLICKLDGKNDSFFTVSVFDSINEKTNDALQIVVDNLQAKIELNKQIDENGKYKWLRSLNELLNSFVSMYKARLMKGVQLYDLIVGFEEAMNLELENRSIKPIVEKYDFEVGETLLKNFGLKTNVGVADCDDVLLLKKIIRYPKKTMFFLTQNPNAYFVDSILISVAYKDPEQLATYAAAPNALGRKIQSVDEPLVKKIGLLSLMKTGRMYFPFLDNLYRNKITMDSITKVINDTTGYYKLLVRTQIEYAERLQHNDTPLVWKGLQKKLKDKAIEFYVNEINALHDKDDKIRFACLKKLSPQDLYYVAVLGEEEIYTSSYLGAYKRIFERMKTPSADTLLAWVNNDHFKKFIKIAANYNTLNDFLGRMDKDSADVLMRKFVSGLEKNNSLEDAVDVANSYSSIYNDKLKSLILDQIEKNLAQCEIDSNKRGQTIYNLLNIIFLSMDSSSHIDVATRLGINGIYEMPINQLKDSSGRIIIQQFIYGDKDGKGVFNSLSKYFPSSIWRKTVKEFWVEHSTIKGTPITIYTNKALDNETDEDAKAQKELGDYLEQTNNLPTMVIHRGHSYFVESTIKQLLPSAKVILLGSCGGYQKLNDVLETCNEAHILSTKQTGTGEVNWALIKIITEQLRMGKNLNWKNIWKALELSFKGQSKEKFDDYVPPHKNLGAIFITAYNKEMEKEYAE